MRHEWNEQLAGWAKPPTEHEEKKGSAAAAMINDALREYPLLKQHQFTVYPTGSYRNNTNVRLGSDIDIAVVLLDSFFFELPSGTDKEALGIRDASYKLDDFRTDVGDALMRKFGGSAVEAGDKTFNVSESSRRLDADVTPFLQYRQYSGVCTNDGSWQFVEGAETRSRKNPSHRILNWHSQHYSEGVKKNDKTDRRFKRITRILKRLRNEIPMPSDDCVDVAERIPSYLIECLVYNVPDSFFLLAPNSYYDTVCHILNYLRLFTVRDELCESFHEVSRMKKLFGPAQAWTRSDAHEFINCAFLRLESAP